MSLYYTDDAVTLHHGPALDVLATLPDGFEQVGNAVPPPLAAASLRAVARP